MNSTSFFDAAADRRGLVRREARQEGRIGDLSWAGSESGRVTWISGTECEGLCMREELDGEETEGATFEKGFVLDCSVVHEGGGRLREPASDGSDKRRGELGMSSWI
jgi:hypothetical protein